MAFELPPDVSLSLLGLMAFVFATGYSMFGATGFGASIISVPILAHWLPLTFLIPLITAIDCVAVLTAGYRQRSQVQWAEFRTLLVPMLIGLGIGMTLLIGLPRNAALLALGVMVGSYAVYVLTGVREWKAIRRMWAVPIGIVGGGFSALFGTGGPVYMMYLSSRIHEKGRLRATSSVVVAMSVVVRAAGFALTSLWLQRGMPLTIMLMIPPTLAGYALGSRLHGRLTSEGVRRGIAMLLLANAFLLVARGLGVSR